MFDFFYDFFMILSLMIKNAAKKYSKKQQYCETLNV